LNAAATSAAETDAVETGAAETSVESLEREDLVMFLNACFACTGQREFYSDRSAQNVSIDFLHRYILGNYRRLYAQTLAVGINHFNQAAIVTNLLATGDQTAPEHQHEENMLITASVSQLPPQRVYRMFETLRERKVNNRRTRAIMTRFITKTRSIEFDAVKYRRRVRAAARHAHVALDDETRQFLRYSANQPTEFTTPMYQAYVTAQYSKEALYSLPFTVAEGIAARRQIPLDELIANSTTMTAAEKLRFQTRAEQIGQELEFDLARAPLTRLASYVLSLTPQERAERQDELDTALVHAAARITKGHELGSVALVVDRSYSARGSNQKRMRPLAVALASVYLMRAVASDCTVYWSPTLERPHLQVTARGQTAIGQQVLAALRSNPDTVLIVSDGFENAPAGLANQVVAAAKTKIEDFASTSFVHLNPVFDAENFAPRSLGPALATVGVRDARDLLTTLSFARFADGSTTLAELEAFLATKTAEFIISADLVAPA